MNRKVQQRAIRPLEILVYAGAYLFFGWLYYTTLWLNRGGTDRYWDLKGFLNWGGIDYALKLILGLPIWWLIFRKLKYLPLYQRLLVHVATLPLFVLTWQYLYYRIIEGFHLYHLTGAAKIWDVYIPTLFYVLQFGIMHAYEYFRDNQENIKREGELQQAVLQSELSALKAQLNPHFLYNVFNTINAAIPPEQEKTRQMIAELSDLFRYQLQASQSETVSLREELAFTSKYLDLEKARFEERLAIEINADDSLLDEQVPPLILQPIVENAVKHGISPLIKGGKISITVVKTVNGQLHFTVTDTGKGIKAKDQLLNKGIGLTNTQLRLNKMFGTSLIFNDHQPQGLEVQFSLG